MKDRQGLSNERCGTVAPAGALVAGTPQARELRLAIEIGNQ